MKHLRQALQGLLEIASLDTIVLLGVYLQLMADEAPEATLEEAEAAPEAAAPAVMK